MYRYVWSVVPGQLGLPDPYLVAAIGDRESNWGEALEPRGPQGTGDGGHGRGLMQIDDRAFPKWCAAYLSDGTLQWQDPVENVRQACRVIREAWLRFLSWPATICAYNAGQAVADLVERSYPPGEAPLAAFDAHTTGGDYVADVIDRWARYSLGVPGGQVKTAPHGLELINPDNPDNGDPRA
jgi:hypothetical protein